MQLWLCWWDIIWLLRPAFSRLTTFLWFVASVAGLTVRQDMFGVTSIVRALGLQKNFYDNLLDNFHSSGINLKKLTKLWARVILKYFPAILRVNGRIVIVGDGIKAPKSGKKMPAVKRLFQQSESNSKPQYIMGHSCQAISILVQAEKSVFAVPLCARIHEGIVTSNLDKKTQMDKMADMIHEVDIPEPFYFTADAYYTNQKIVKSMLSAGNHLVVRARSNAVAYYPNNQRREPHKAGRNKIYGQKVALKSLFNHKSQFLQGQSPVYGEKDVTIQYLCADLLWRPVGIFVRFVLVIHPTRGRWILMTTDTSLCPMKVIEIYGLRYKIEHTFKQAVHVIGAFSYHFWMAGMKPLRRKSGNQYLHKETKNYRDKVTRKIHAYHVYIQASFIAQGLLQYLSCAYPDRVWKVFKSWIRTIRPGIPPSEFVVAMALRNSLPQFLLGTNKNNILTKFITDRQDIDRFDAFKLIC